MHPSFLKTGLPPLILPATFIALLWAPVQLTAQAPTDEAFEPSPEAFNTIDAPPEARRELDALLSLTLEQQKQRAKALIEEYPDTELARTLQRLMSEYDTFRQLDEQGRLARDARSSYSRAYWHSRCCRPPAWNPPLAQLTNGTTTPVLYQQKLDGLHATVWSGPYRLRPGATYDSPHPFRVRYLTAGGPAVIGISPGSSFTFQGSADDGSLELVPGYVDLAPLPATSTLTVPTPSPAE